MCFELTSGKRRNDGRPPCHASSEWLADPQAKGEQPSEVLANQDAAIERAREIVQHDGGGELVIHGQDGQIRDKRTIGPA